MKNSENLRTKCKSGCFRFTFILGFCCDGLKSPAGLAYMFRFPISDFVMISENCFFPFSSYAHGSTCIWKDERQTPRRTSRENMKNSENLCTKCQSGCFRFTLLGFCCGGLISPAGLAYMFRFPISDFVMISENCFFPFSSYAHGSTCIWKDERQTPRRTSRGLNWKAKKVY